MYHDEFARKPARPMLRGEDILPDVALEIGGGLSLGLAASLNQPASMILYYLGGLLPLVTCSLSIAAHRAFERLARIAPASETVRPSALPAPHYRPATIAATGRLHAAERTASRR